MSHELEKKVEELEKKLKEYEEILEYYAHPETYKLAGNNIPVVMCDLGWNARNALNSLREDEK